MVVGSCRRPCVPAGRWRSSSASKPLTAADQDARGEHQRAAECHLQCGRNRRRVHVFPAHPADHREFDHDHDARRRPSRSRTTGSGTAGCGRCRPAWSSRREMAPRTIGAPRPVRLPLSDSASAKPMEMPAPIEAASPTRNASQVLLRGEGGGEHRRQGGDRAVHQPGQPGLDHPQHERGPGARVLAAADIVRQVLVAQLVGAMFMLHLGVGQVAEQLAHRDVLAARGGGAVEALGLGLHAFGEACAPRRCSADRSARPACGG